MCMFFLLCIHESKRSQLCSLELVPHLYSVLVKFVLSLTWYHASSSHICQVMLKDCSS